MLLLLLLLRRRLWRRRVGVLRVVRGLRGFATSRKVRRRLTKILRAYVEGGRVAIGKFGRESGSRREGRNSLRHQLVEDGVAVAVGATTRYRMSPAMRYRVARLKMHHIMLVDTVRLADFFVYRSISEKA